MVVNEQELRTHPLYRYHVAGLAMWYQPLDDTFGLAIPTFAAGYTRRWDGVHVSVYRTYTQLQEAVNEHLGEG